MTPGYLSSKIPEVFNVPKIDLSPMMQMQAAMGRGQGAPSGKSKSEGEDLKIDGLIGDDIAHYNAISLAERKMSSLLKAAGGDASLLAGNVEFARAQQMMEKLASPQILDAIQEKRNNVNTADERLKGNFKNANLNAWKALAPMQQSGRADRLGLPSNGVIENGKLGNIVRNSKSNINPNTGEIDLNDDFTEAFTTEQKSDYNGTVKRIQDSFSGLGKDEIKQKLIGRGSESMGQGNIGDIRGILSRKEYREWGDASKADNISQVFERMRMANAALGINDEDLHSIEVNLLTNSVVLDNKTYVPMIDKTRMEDEQSIVIPNTQKDADNVGGILKDGKIYVPIQSEYTDKDGNVRNVNDETKLKFAAMLYGERLIRNMGQSMMSKSIDEGKDIRKQEQSFSIDQDGTKRLRDDNEELKNLMSGSVEVNYEVNKTKLGPIPGSNMKDVIGYMKAHSEENPSYGILVAEIEKNNGVVNEKTLNKARALGLVTKEAYQEALKTGNKGIYSLVGKITPDVEVVSSDSRTSVLNAAGQKNFFDKFTQFGSIGTYTENHQDMKDNPSKYIKMADGKYIRTDHLEDEVTRTGYSISDPVTGRVIPRRPEDDSSPGLWQFGVGFGRTNVLASMRTGLDYTKDGIASVKDQRNFGVGMVIQTKMNKDDLDKFRASEQGKKMQVAVPAAISNLQASKDKRAAFADIMRTIKKANPNFNEQEYMAKAEKVAGKEDNKGLKSYLAINPLVAAFGHYFEDEESLATLASKAISMNRKELHQYKGTGTNSDLTRMVTKPMFESDGKMNLGVNMEIVDDELVIKGNVYTGVIQNRPNTMDVPKAETKPKTSIPVKK